MRLVGTTLGIEQGLVTNHSVPILGQTVPSPCHFHKLIALVPSGHLLGQCSALLSVFSIFRSRFHGSLWCSFMRGHLATPERLSNRICCSFEACPASAMERGWRAGLAVKRNNKNLFKGRQFTAEIILWAARWYLQFSISYRDLERMFSDRGVQVDHTILFRWIQAGMSH
ncbi:hypothetical protein MicloDRAFT_00069380 [Microvirga lotononidis]|uniref:Transposase n=1 Tax=Microvirga lotononidis TaxID=864069 RepID=I4YKC7_9HYPH|nr:hypothetical protein MicloDRAFT_00069380 [Microvirga lotononidis]